MTGLHAENIDSRGMSRLQKLRESERSLREHANMFGAREKHDMQTCRSSARLRPASGCTTVYNDFHMLSDKVARSCITQKHMPRITCSLSSTKGGIQCMRAIAMSAAAALLPMPQPAVASPPSERVILRIWAAHSCDRRVMQNLTQHAHDVRETTSSPAAVGQRLEQQN